MSDEAKPEPVRVFLIADPDDYGMIPVVELTKEIIRILEDAGVEIESPKR
jgi:hypothetical protein